LETSKHTLVTVLGTLCLGAVICFSVATWVWFFVPEWTDAGQAKLIFAERRCYDLFPSKLRAQCWADWSARYASLRTNKWTLFDPALGMGTIFVTTLGVLFARWLESTKQDIRTSSKWLSLLLSLTATILVGIGMAASFAQDESRNITSMYVDTPGGALLFGAILSGIITAIMMMPFMLMIIFMGRPTSRIFTPFNGRVRWQILRLITFLPTLALVSLLLFGGIMYGNIYFCMSAVFMGFGLLDAQAHWANHTHRKMEQTSGDITQS
jgi:hypothetical protein